MGPLPNDLMADLSDILEDDDYTPEKRVHQIVWQALKYGMNAPRLTRTMERRENGIQD